MDVSKLQRPIRYVRLSVLLFLLLLAPLAFAQEADFSFMLDEAGNATFTQRVRWKTDPVALRYEFVLYDEGDDEIDRRETQGGSIELNLPPGTYRFRIIGYNLLEQEETVTDLGEIIVERAEFPAIKTFKPGAINLDEEEPAVLTIDGAFLMSGAKIFLVDQTKNSKRGDIEGTFLEQENNEIAVVEFPKDALRFGSYLIKVRNPGGLEGVSERIIRVRYRKPIDFYLAVDYAPVFPLYDSFYRKYWPDPFYLRGAGGRAGLFVFKRRNFFLGLELQGSYLQGDGGITEAKIVSEELNVGGNLVGTYLLGPTYRLVGRAGGGVSLLSLGFDYAGRPGASMESPDPYALIGLSGQWFFWKHAFAELGADWTNVFRIGYAEGRLQPRFSVGLYY